MKDDRGEKALIGAWIIYAIVALGVTGYIGYLVITALLKYIGS